MGRWDCIKRFLEAVQDKTSHIHPVYRRNFRELVKVIPLIGSVVDANTMGAVEDAIIEERLSNLESSCERALKTRDVEMLTAEILNINSIFFVLIVTTQADILRESRKIAEELKRVSERNGYELYAPVHRDFVFVTISGPSAVGKDCVLGSILARASKGPRSVEALTKFTNRPRRLVDSRYYNFLSDDEYDLLERSRNIIFPYWKRDFRYGFDKTHLFNSASQPQVLFCIFTHFGSLPTDQDFLRDRGINHIAVLLTANEDVLLRRSGRRLLEQRDIDARNRSIEEDLKPLRDNQRMVKRCFDLVIDNGDGHSVEETCNKIFKKVGLKEVAFENTSN